MASLQAAMTGASVRLAWRNTMNKLDERTTIPVKWSIALAAAVASGVWFTASVKSDIEALQRDVVALTATVAAFAPSDRWTATDQRNWARQLAESNPSIRIPPPERVR